MIDLERMDFAFHQAVWVNQVFDEVELLPTSRLVAYYLSRLFYFDEFSKERCLYCYPNCTLLAEKSGCSISNVRLAVSELKRAGHLRVTDFFGDHGTFECIAMLAPRRASNG